MVPGLVLEEHMGSYKQRLSTLGVLMTGAALLAACTATPPAANPASAGAGNGADDCSVQRNIPIAYDTISQGIWPLWVAKEQGILAKYGITGELVFIEGSRVIAGIVGQSTPIGMAAGTDILGPVAEGADILAIAATLSTPTDTISVTKDINSAADLKGKVAGANELGGEADALLRLGLAKLGLVPDVDVRIVSVGGESTRIAALKSDQVQATIVDVGLRDEMLAQGFKELYDFTEGEIKMLKNALLSTKSYVTANPGTIQCVVNALVEGIAFYKANKAESVDAAAKYSGDMSRESLEKLWDIYATKLPAKPLVEADALKNAQGLSADPKVLAIDVATVIDNSFVEGATVAP
jgi:ABC-type nitrate/sulfonate/bicarbonate transport system substrate-binding protein